MRALALYRPINHLVILTHRGWGWERLPRRGRSGLHGRQLRRRRHRVRQRVMRRLARVVILIRPALVLTACLGGVAAERLARRGGRPAVVHVVHVCAVLFRSGLLLHRWKLVLPLTNTLGAYGWRSLVGALGSCSFGSGESRGGRGGAVGDATRGWSLSVRLVLLVGVGSACWGGDPVVENRAHFRVWAVPAKRRDGSWTTGRWWSVKSVRWCGREDVPCGSTVVRVQDTHWTCWRCVWLRWRNGWLLLLNRRWVLDTWSRVWPRKRVRRTRAVWWCRAHVARLLVWAHLLIRPWARLTWWRRWSSACLAVLVRVRWLRRRVDLSQSIGGPVSWSRAGWWSRWCRRSCLRGSSPLRPWRAHGVSGLVRIGMHVLRNWRSSVHRWHALSISEELQACLDVDVAGVQLVRALVRIERITDLIVARLILQVWLAMSRTRSACTRRWSLPECQGRTRLRKCTG